MTLNGIVAVNMPYDTECVGPSLMKPNYVKLQPDLCCRKCSPTLTTLNDLKRHNGRQRALSLR